MTDRKPKRPRDPNQLAKRIVDIATGEDAEPCETGFTKRASAGGRKGGPARAAKLTPEQRSEIARAAASARWKKGRLSGPIGIPRSPFFHIIAKVEGYLDRRLVALHGVVRFNVSRKLHAIPDDLLPSLNERFLHELTWGVGHDSPKRVLDSTFRRAYRVIDPMAAPLLISCIFLP